MYALATIPLIKKLKIVVENVNQVWFADDASGAGQVKRLREWWDVINTQGPRYGYFSNASKPWLVTKKDLLPSAPQAGLSITKLTPVLIGRPPPNDTERDLLALPGRLGGIALSIPTQATDSEFLSSTKITEALKGTILQQDFQYAEEVIALQLEAKSDVHKLRREQAKQESDLLKGNLAPSLQRSMVLA